MFEQIKHSIRGIFVLYGTGLWGLIVICTLSSRLRCCFVDASYFHFVVDQLSTHLTVSLSPLNPTRPILFTLAISQGKGLCLLFSLFSNSLFCFSPDDLFHCSVVRSSVMETGCPFFVIISESKFENCFGGSKLQRMV